MHTEPIATDPHDVHLVLRMKPPWTFVDDIRRFVESLCACVGAEGDREAQLALAVHELLQNAIPHSNGEAIELALQLDVVRDRVSVAVSNACTDAEYEELRSRVERMNAEPDPLRFYVETMHTSPPDEHGGFGLARIRFEGQLELSLSRSGGRVTVRAEGALSVAPIAAGLEGVA